MWIMIFNSLDIDFIHRDIYGRSCKKSSWYIFSWKLRNTGSQIISIQITNLICQDPLVGLANL